MFDKKRLRIAIAIVVIAGLAGYVMQNSGASAARINAVSQAKPEPVLQFHDPVAVGLIDLAEVEAALPAILDRPDLPGAFRVAALESPHFPRQNQSRQLLFAQPCDSNLTATASAGALARITLSAPCFREHRLVVSHAGLTFADVTDENGGYSALVPLLDADAPITVRLSQSQTASVPAPQVALEQFERAAIMWSGATGLHIHALEGGAGFGSPGHVWAQQPGNPEAEGNFLIQLGNPELANPLLAEVYSAPVAPDGSVDLIVEAAVNKGFCGTRLTAVTFLKSPGRKLADMDVFVAMPDCESASGYLLLKNLFQDLRLTLN